MHSFQLLYVVHAFRSRYSRRYAMIIVCMRAIHSPPAWFPISLTRGGGAIYILPPHQQPSQTYFDKWCKAKPDTKPLTGLQNKLNIVPAINTRTYRVTKDNGCIPGANQWTRWGSGWRDNDGGGREYIRLDDGGRPGAREGGGLIRPRPHMLHIHFALFYTWNMFSHACMHTYEYNDEVVQYLYSI